MSENNQNSTNNSKNPKQRLGCGLGSLLGGVPNQGADFTDQPKVVETAKPIVATPVQSAAPVAKPISAPIAPAVEIAKPAIEPVKTETFKKAVIISRPGDKIETPVAAASPAPVSAAPLETVAPVKTDAPAAVLEASEKTATTEIVPEVKAETIAESKIETAPVVETTPISVSTPAPVVQAAPTIPDNQRIWNIPVEKLVANTQQPRQVFEDGALRELSNSIREKGILQPITAQRLNEREFQIISGERRWRAAQMAGLKEVPVILRTVSEQDSLELAILENIQRADLNPIEESEAYDLLMKTYGLTQAQVADRLGKERSSVANALRLMALPPEVKLMIGGGELSSGHAKVLLGLESMSDQISLAKEVIREKLSVRALEKKVAEKKSMGSGAVSAARPGMGLDVSSKLVEALAGELQKLIGTRVVIDYADRRGKLSVYFHSDEQLTEIVERMRKGWAKSNGQIIQGQNPSANASSRV